MSYQTWLEKPYQDQADEDARDEELVERWGWLDECGVEYLTDDLERFNICILGVKDRELHLGLASGLDLWADSGWVCEVLENRADDETMPSEVYRLLANEEELTREQRNERVQQLRDRANEEDRGAAEAAAEDEFERRRMGE